MPKSKGLRTVRDVLRRGLRASAPGHPDVAGLVHTTTAAPGTPRSGSANASPPRSATPTTTRWRRRSTVYETEVINPRKPWRSVDKVELATAEWVNWFNHHRLYKYCGDIPPAELEAAYYAK
jgi:transposase InsO family protein